VEAGVTAGVTVLEVGRLLGDEAKCLQYLLLGIRARKVEERHVIVAQANLQIPE
jgi:hypothetical protein